MRIRARIYKYTSLCICMRIRERTCRRTFKCYEPQGSSAIPASDEGEYERGQVDGACSKGDDERRFEVRHAVPDLHVGAPRFQTNAAEASVDIHHLRGSTVYFG